MHGRTLIVVAATALLLSGCGDTGSDAPVRSAGTAGTIPAECPDGVQPYPDYRAGPHLPDDVQPVGVLRCVVTEEDDPATGRWRVVLTQTATTGIEDYIAGLRMPDEPRPDGDLFCTSDLLLLPWSAVILPDGRALQVAMPVTACGKPRIEPGLALERLEFTTVRTERVEQIAPPAQLDLEKRAAALGCAYVQKDMLEIEAGDGPDSGDRPLLSSSPTRMAACRFAADVDAGEPRLTFDGAGRRLTAAETAVVVEALSATRPTTEACRTPHTAVWSLQGAGSGPSVLVELDGCGRVSSDSGALRTLPAAALATIRDVLEAG
jgi:hypothetical protein